MDVKTAFLNGSLEEPVYMDIPKGVSVSELTKKTQICKLNKAIYGLKISPKRWNKKFTEVVLALGLQNTIHEPCLYTYRENGNVAVIVLYVDDMLIASNDEKKMEEIKECLEKAFEMKDLGEPSQFLGMRIKRDRVNRIIQIDQAEYAEKILERFGMKQCVPKLAPMFTRQNYTKRQKKQIQSEIPKPKFPYREAIGSLLYLAGGTRPDISFAVNVLSRQQTSPNIDDWEDVLTLLQYIRATTKLGLKYSGDTDYMEAYTDASFADWSDNTSTGGYLILMYGDPVNWRSHKQTGVNLSTGKAEYMAMSDLCREIIFLDKAQREITGKYFYPVQVWCDNEAAVKNAQMEGSHRLNDFDDDIETIKENLKYRERTGVRKEISEKHGDYVKQLVVKEGKIQTGWVHTSQNIADIFTKPLEYHKHIELTNKMLHKIRL